MCLANCNSSVFINLFKLSFRSKNLLGFTQTFFQSQKTKTASNFLLEIEHGWNWLLLKRAKSWINFWRISIQFWLKFEQCYYFFIVAYLIKHLSEIIYCRNLLKFLQHPKEKCRSFCSHPLIHSLFQWLN